MPKPRSDSKIRPEHKPQLRAWLVDENLSYAETAKRMEEAWGYRVSTGTLSKFYATDCFSLRYSRARELADGLDLPPEQFDSRILAAVKQAAFELALDKEGNVAALSRLMRILGDSAKLRIKSRELELDERKVAILERKAALADAAEHVTRDDSLTPEQREARMREIFGLK